MALITSNRSFCIQGTIIVCLTTALFFPASQTEFFTSKSMIQFDPYVSILDRVNRSRYDVGDLQFMIAKVATRFSRIYIEIEEKYLYYKDPSICLAALATAQYNCLRSAANKIEVWVALIDSPSSSNRIKVHSVNRMRQMANVANDVCNGTVTTMLFTERMMRFLDHKPTHNNSKAASLSHNLLQRMNVSIGFLIGSPGMCERAINTFQPAVILVHQGIGELSKNKQLYFAHDLGKLLKTCKLESRKLNRTITWAVTHSVPDTDMNNLVNITFLVSSWVKEIKWAIYSGNMVVFQKAFDTPYKASRINQIVGWWRLKENPMYTDIKEYLFEEKFANAENIDWEENPKNFNWLQKPVIFNSNLTGVIYDVSRIYESNSDLTRLHETISRNFTKELFVQEWLVEPSIQQSNENLIKSGFTNFTFLIPLTKNPSTVTRNAIKTHAKNHNLKYGYCFKMVLCEMYTHLNTTSGQQLFDILENTDNSLFVFNYDENEETIKLGARRMYERRVVLFEQCRRMVINSGNSQTEIAFALLEYPKHKNFYQSSWHLQNYVKYWKLLNSWATKEENVTIFLHATDQKAYRAGTPVPGWWTFEKFIDQNGSQTLRITDKRELALKISESQYPPADHKHYMSSLALGLIISSSLALCGLLVILSAFCMKRYYRQPMLSKEDLINFFQGQIPIGKEYELNLGLIPYDKERYEIAKYSINQDKILGTGEFGKVLHGNVERSGIDICVAIKTTNPVTNHSSTLKGLLSEVKLLAYIGKHKNIIELIGADTTQIKRGKILIFLELCHLGSLQKCLRKIRIPTDNAVVHQYSKEPSKFTNRYTNVYKNARKSLDSGLSKDLYRWSTEICNGMAYLAEKHVVHADLATRNILLSLRMEAKICDFGLSRRMYNYTNYVKDGHDPMPWKWMAPESLRFRQFSEKSDVWAFGITLWEIYTLGETPYQGLSWDVNFAQMLESGLRPSEPTYDENDMFQVMSDCWKSNIEERPTFSRLLDMINANGLKET